MSRFALPFSETHECMLDAWAEFHAWLAWQVRVPFTYANGSTKLDVPMRTLPHDPRYCRTLVTPPPQRETPR